MFKRVVPYCILMLLVIPALLFWFSHRGETGDADAPKQEKNQSGQSATGSPDKPAGKKIKYWVAPMDPTYIRNEPGKSPMGMDLVPVYEEEGEKSSEGVIRIDPVTIQTIGIRTAPVTRARLSKTIRTVGRITYDEERVEHIHTKVSGWIERLNVRTTGEQVVKGQELLSFYSPELVATQEEYLQALKYRDRTAVSSFPDVAESGRSLVEAAKKRLQLMDIDDEQIENLENTMTVQKNMVLKSGKSGTVIAKNVVDGMKVDPMMELYTIADLSRVWVLASIYEYELPFLSLGQEVEMTLAYDPGARYRGKVTFIYPFLSTATRTVQVRMEFDNPGLKLKPDMYVDVVIQAAPKKQELLVPSEAIIRTGSRNVVITSLGQGKFLPREVTLGLEGEGMVQVLKGLSKDETVVTSGQFLIDSESNLKEAINKMIEATAPTTKEEPPPAEKVPGSEKQSTQPLPVRDDQKKIISELLNHYLEVHRALVDESPMKVAEKTHFMHSVLDTLKTSDSDKTLKGIIDAMDASMEGLHSGDLQTARTSFKTLSRAMSELIKSSIRDRAQSEDINLYFCPMENEPWIQKGSELRNPYLGKDMWICGIEEPY